jgi:hypothetical protein
MVTLKDQGVYFKILPEGSDFIIGSHSKKSRGDYYARK